DLGLRVDGDGNAGFPGRERLLMLELPAQDLDIRLGGIATIDRASAQALLQRLRPRLRVHDREVRAGVRGYAPRLLATVALEESGIEDDIEARAQQLASELVQAGVHRLPGLAGVNAARHARV